SEALDTTNCLVLDVGLPGMSGPDLQQELKRRRKAIPIVFITAQGDRSLAPRLIGHGAVACLFKPFSDTALLDVIAAALRRNEAWRREGHRTGIGTRMVVPRPGALSTSNLPFNWAARSRIVISPNPREGPRRLRSKPTPSSATSSDTTPSARLRRTRIRPAPECFAALPSAS